MTQHKPVLLINLLKQEVNWIDSLIRLLSEEKNILVARQFEALEPLANQKQTISEQLEQSARQRVELLGLDQYDTQPKLGLQEFLSHCSKDEAEQINSLNKELAEKLIQCRELNAVNGQVIATNVNSHQEVIGIITGQNNTEATSVYTATGNIESSSDKSRHQKA
ncbi:MULTISPECIES: flagella synthesis protein FlgN [unclassified Legionella]|uniref:flagella synthesis protein FlgN n=1 Tax=unclassified Legionella TaxID=2622702 RepID=UPI0010567002|nr:MULTISPECIES: flagellar protein FlgN [unclassified Legionella]MDI9819296.1 flagellar protein FlgN [Legionella sp. PL877]